MLYSLYEAQHTALMPLRYWAELSRGWFGHPFSPFVHLPLARRVAAAGDLFLRLTGRYEKPQRNIPDVEIEAALERPFCRLIHFRPGRADRAEGLALAPLSG